MIKIGIIGLGNVTWNVHLPILLTRKDLDVSWVCELDFSKKDIIEKKRIKFFDNLDHAIKYKKVDIILITTPYGERKKIFEKIKNYCGGIFFEKPHALTLDEHKYFSKNFKSCFLTVGYTKRRMGIVNCMKKIIDQNIFGKLKNVNIFFGDIHYKFDNFRSDIKKSGGGIFFEAGTHWFDCVLFTTFAKDIIKFKSKIKYENDLDIESIGNFEIIDNKNDKISCKFKISTLENTKNKIEYHFENCSIDLFLFDNNSSLKIKNNKNSQFILQDNEFLNYPSSSYEVAWVYWDDFLNSFKLKKEIDLSYNSYYLTSKITELFYEK